MKYRALEWGIRFGLKIGMLIEDVYKILATVIGSWIQYGDK
jgi:hypothetical protein